MNRTELTALVASKKVAIKKLLFDETPPATPADFATVTLVDGTEVTVLPALEVGATAKVMGNEGEIDAPDGDHELQDGTIIVVAGGVITEVKEVAEAAAAKPPAPTVTPDQMAAALAAQATALRAEFSAMLNPVREGTKAVFEVVEAMAAAPAAAPVETKTNPFGPKPDMDDFATKLQNALKHI